LTSSCSRFEQVWT